MENTPTPFDLNRSIRQWRESLDQSPAFRRENLDELETHLRDSIANLEQRGLAADEALIIATKRVGTSTALGVEFGKLNPHGIWLNRALWMLVGTQVFGFIHTLVDVITTGTAGLGIRPLMSLSNASSAQHYIGLLFGFVHLLSFAVVLATVWWLISRKTNGISAWLRNLPQHLSRSIAMVALCLFPMLLSYPIEHYESLFYHNMMSGGRQFFMPIDHGFAVATYAEWATLIVLTWLLARRQLIARTGS